MPHKIFFVNRLSIDTPKLTEIRITEEYLEKFGFNLIRAFTKSTD